jgi:hypothetical protein
LATIRHRHDLGSFNGRHQVIEDRFGLEDEEYWSDIWRTRRTVQRPLMQSGTEGLMLGAPPHAPMDQHEDLPVALLRVCKPASAARLPTHAYVVLAAVDLATWELRARLALPPRPAPPAPPSASGAPPAPDSFSGDDTAMLSEGHTVDLAALLELPEARREYLVTAILLDQVSNRVSTKRVESAGYQDDAVDSYLGELLAARMKPPEVHPPAGDPLPVYAANEQSPPLPGRAGVALVVPRVSAFGPEEECVVRGSFRLEIRAQHRSRPKDAAGPDRQPQAAPAPEAQAAPGPEETARVPISLLLIGSADPNPLVVRLVVPCTEPVQVEGERPIAIGYFAFDLAKIPGVKISPQTYFIYAFAGEAMTGPIPAAFVRLPVEDAERATSSSW